MQFPLEYGLRRRNRRGLLNDDMRICPAKAKGADPTHACAADLGPRCRLGRDNEGDVVPRYVRIRIFEMEISGDFFVLK